MLKDTSQGYGLITILIHWITGLLILGLFGLGIYMTGLGYYDPWYHKGPWVHVSLGLLLFVLMVVRLVWRSKNATPVALHSHSAANIAATATKHSLYLLLFVVMISGYLINTAEGKSASFFDWLSVPSLMILSATQVDWLGRIHLWGAWLIIALVVLHTVGALIHHFVWRDRTLIRIIKPVSRNK